MLHLKYRPKTLDKVVGNQSVVNSMDAMLSRKKKDIPHAWLFKGDSGCGKTTLARIVKDQLKCSKGDFIEINTSNNRGIDTAREILTGMNFSPIEGKVKVYLLDEVHQTTKDFQNSILKALEDTPKHVYFLLCTTEPEKLLKTIVNRCTTFSVSTLSDKETRTLIKRVLKKEKRELSKKLIKKIVEAVDGCARQALVILDQVIDLDDEMEIECAINSHHDKKAAIDLCRQLAGSASWARIRQTLQDIEGDPEQIRRTITGYIASIVLRTGKLDPKYMFIYECFNEPFFYNGKPGLIFACADVYSENEKTDVVI